jgi:hypothetical protein
MKVARALISSLLCLSLALISCDGDLFKPEERSQALSLFRRGASFETDEYVRAETLRVLELVGDKRMVTVARERVEKDKSAMVRVTALRVLHTYQDEDADRLTIAEYNVASDEGRLVLLAMAREFGRDELVKQLVGQALRSKNQLLKQRAFEYGPFQQLDEAAKNNDEQRLRKDLIPEVARLLTGDDTDLAGLALRRLVALGEENRADVFIKRFEDASRPAPERIQAGHILWRARVTRALPLFQAAIAASKATGDVQELGLPQDRQDTSLLRVSIMGAVALGDESQLNAIQQYLKNAKEDDYIDVLEALAESPADEASISIKIAMSDSRLPIRRRAISLYGARPNAEARSLINAMRQADPLSRQMIAGILIRRFASQWGQELRLQLRADESAENTLTLLREVLQGSDRDKALLEPLLDDLTKLSKDASKPERSAQAAYLLLLNDPSSSDAIKLLRERSDDSTRYAFLELLMKTRAQENRTIFRAYAHDDHFAIRLMSSAGLWRGYEVKPGAPAKP